MYYSVSFEELKQYFAKHHFVIAIFYN